MTLQSNQSNLMRVNPRGNASVKFQKYDEGIFQISKIIILKIFEI